MLFILLTLTSMASESLTVTTSETTAINSQGTLSIGDRLKIHSDDWVGLPYGEGSFGEGGGVDSDPMIRRDMFDCLTMVEEALALSLAHDPVAVQRVRMGLRYRNGGPATYENRRHFMLAEWIPGTIEDGWMRDITSEFAGAVSMEWRVTADTWANWSRRGLFSLTDDRLPTGSQTVTYLPIEAAQAAINEIPEGAIIFTLREPFPHLPIAITHVGMTIPGEDPTVRHATKIGDDMVRDHPLLWYLQHLETYVNWPAAGIIILMPQDYGPRRTHLER